MRIAVSRGHKDVVKRILSVLDSENVLQFLMGLELSMGESDKIDEEKSCVVCMENSRDAVVVPCGHTACCYSCLEALPVPRMCPICRVEVRMVQKMYPLLSFDSNS